MANAISAQGLCMDFGKRRVLDNVTLTVAEGEIFGLLGPSGAGKTTLIRLLTGQLRQTAGTAALLGADTGKLTGRERGQIGMMMDDFGLYERLSVWDNMLFYADIYKTPKNTLGEILGEVGLYESRKTAVAKLSKGMRNRLSLARAMMNHGKLLFLDEPTAGLDPATARQIHGILLRLRERGITVFLTTHNMQEAETLCDHVALLSAGKIVEYGEPAAICRKYNRLNQLQITLHDGSQVCLENGSASAQRVKTYLEQNQIAAIHSTEPTLETVLIALTGKGLDT